MRTTNQSLFWLLPVLAATSAVAAVEIDLRTYVERARMMSSYADRYLSTADFSGDGKPDLLIGGENSYSLEKSPIVLLINLGDGTFADGTRTFIDGSPAANAPIGVTADFNNDGQPDVAIFDAGNLERGQDSAGGFYGEAPLLILSAGHGKWRVSAALADAAREINSRLHGTGSALHAKSAAAGDIDADGDIDIWVESSGGFRQVRDHFMINNGDATFTSDVSEERFPEIVRTGASRQWRYISSLLVDVNRDGALDLVLGQLKRTDNRQEELTSKVLFNDGSGRFSSSRVVELPAPAFAGGYSTVRSMLSTDVNGDGATDLILVHTRSADDHKPQEPIWSGRYVQVLINDLSGRFRDETDMRMGDQGRTASAQAPDYGFNFNSVRGVRSIDIDGDGDRDLMMAEAESPVGPSAPMFHLNDGSGVFRVLDPFGFTRGQTWFGENAIPINMDGDAVIDFVHSDLLPGADQRYGTGDEYSRLIVTLGRRP